tara:strand:- start:47 stop:1738 length:1692 start_codon:yes stop_codon:yes gene_type:complete
MSSLNSDNGEHYKMSMGMGMSMGLSLRQSLTQRLVVSMPPMNWSLVKAFEEEGDQPLRFKKDQFDTSGMGLEERLQAVDDANEVFRFAYTKAEGSDRNGKKLTGHYKIPLMRDYNVEIDDIKIKISRGEYDKATTILNGAGRFQRIARAVPYSQLHQDVKGFVGEQGYSLEDVVVVGVDRGGRLPSFIMREALGKDESYTLKVDQAGGSSGELDREKLNELMESGVLKDKFVLFVDSTVDSGRQIEVLKRYFDSGEWKERIGHREWGVVGSNENGHDHYKHRNLNWGLNPDESFEDNPLLMGVDYAGQHDLTKVVDCPSRTSERIKSALLEVPSGVILDTSDLSGLVEIKKAYSQFDKAIESQGWRKAQDRYWSQQRKDLGVSGVEAVALGYEGSSPRKRLLVVGNGSEVDLSEEEARFVADSLAQGYDIIAGTPSGNPGSVLDLFSQSREGSAQLYQPRYRSDEGAKTEQFGNKVIFHGETKPEFRENLVQSADAILVLGGNEGTLRETILSAHAGKPTYLVSGFGAVGHYAGKARSLKKFDNVHVVKTLPDAVEGLRQLYK